MNDLHNLAEQFPAESLLETQPRAYINHSVQFKRPTTVEERILALEAVGNNVFQFPAEMISGCDLLSDSGTTTMTAEQWAALHLGDESYGTNQGYSTLMRQVGETFGEAFAQDSNPRKPHTFLFHQGRAAEHALFTMLGRKGSGQIIPSNGHFDTTQANVEANQIEARNLFSPKLHDEQETQFKGDMDTARLRSLLEESADRVPAIFLTITNNTGGGQPVSMANIKETAALAREFSTPFMLDACRFAENAWFIKQNESGYADKSIPEIVREIFAEADGFTISFKKDGLANMGGGLFFRRDGAFAQQQPELLQQLRNHQILTEGHPTYGGMSGRDIMTVTEGLRTVTREEYLGGRIAQVQEFGQAMHDAKLPALTPVGGHAVYLDMNKFFEGTAMRREDFGGIAFTGLLLALYGHRACELGDYAFGHVDPNTGKEVPHAVNYVRFAVPRSRYESRDLLSVVDAVKALHDNRERIPKVQVVEGQQDALRHFNSTFSLK